MKSCGKKYNNLIKIEIILSVIVLVLLLIGVSNIYIDVVAITIYLLLIYSLFLIHTKLLIKYFFFILTSTWSVVAVFFMENASVTVAGDNSYHYGAFAIYVFAWLVYYLTIIAAEKKHNAADNRELEYYLCKSQNNKNKINAIKYIVLFGTVIEIIAFLSICTKPYYLYGADRIAYANTVLPFWLNGHIGFFAIIIPLAVMVMDKDIVLSSTFVILYFLINLWVGEKFTGHFLGIYFLIFSYIGLYGYRMKIQKIKKVVYILCIIALLLIPLVYFQITVIQGRDFVYYMKERISAQGYLWWLTYSKDVGKGMHLSELRDELLPFYTKLSGHMSDYNFGIYKLMKLYYAPARWKNMLDYGFRGTESTRATFYYYGKMPGLIGGQLLLGLLTGKISSLCFRYLRKLDYIRAFFAFYILRNFIAIYSMSDFYLFVKPAMILSYIMIIFGGRLNFAIRNPLPKVKLGYR